ncbi:unnamed protein product, partial [Musa acuminata var. zebrina]
MWRGCFQQPPSCPCRFLCPHCRRRLRRCIGWFGCPPWELLGGLRTGEAEEGAVPKGRSEVAAVAAQRRRQGWWRMSVTTSTVHRAPLEERSWCWLTRLSSSSATRYLLWMLCKRTTRVPAKNSLGY